MSEAEVSKEIVNMIKKEFKDFLFITRYHCGTARGLHGGIIQLGSRNIPDYVGYCKYNGVFFGLEIKAPKAKTAKDREAGQTAFREEANKCGAYSLITNSVEDCRKQLELLKARVKENTLGVNPNVCNA